MPKGSPSVLIIRLDGIGDALALAPLLAAFRARGICVDVVLQNSNARVFSAQAIRRVVRAGFRLRSNSKSDLLAVARLGTELAQQQYSHVLVATEDPAGYRLAHATRAPERIGFHNGWAKPLKRIWTSRLLTCSIYRAAAVGQGRAHECEVLFRLGAPLIGDGAPTRDVTALRPLVLDKVPAIDDHIGVQLTEKWRRFGIPIHDVIELVRRACERNNVRLFSSQAEGAYAARIARETATTVEYFDDVKGWEEAIASVTTLITPDCGALQVAGMIGTPVVGIFPAKPNFSAQTARWAPWASPQRLLPSDRGWPARAIEAAAAMRRNGAAP